ncbi:Methyl-accepting chemotaxis protein (MCP) signalling domain containing protein [Rhabdaerophilaceae bacterium]
MVGVKELKSPFAFLSRSKSAVAHKSDVPVQVAPERPVEAEPRQNSTAQGLELFEQDVNRLVDTLAVEIGGARDRSLDAVAHLDSVEAAVSRLVGHAEICGKQVESVTQSTDAFAEAASEIAHTLGQVFERSSKARERADHSARDMEQLGLAVQDIGGQLTAIAEIASRTNLLALNATIEAARAGEAGRGFAVVAQEVKALSVAASQAVSAIRGRMEALEAVSARTTAGMQGIASDVGELAPICGTISDAVQEQRQTIEALLGQMQTAQSSVSGIAQAVKDIRSQTAETVSVSRDATALNEMASADASSLRRRMSIVLRSMEAADRRKHERFPIDLAIRLHIQNETVACRSFDLSEGGVLIKAHSNLKPTSGATYEADIARIGKLRLTVVNITPMGVHCAFAGLSVENRQAISEQIGVFQELHRPLIDRSKAFAADIVRAIETDMQAGRLSETALFDTGYTLIPDSDPKQYRTQYLERFDIILPPLLETALGSDPALTFAVAIDRNGYIPVHNKGVSQPQRPGDRAWNMANSRNRRIFDDRAGLLAGRVTGSSLIQTYNRDMGNGVSIQMKEVDAPILIAGRHWGGVRMAYKL